MKPRIDYSKPVQTRAGLKAQVLYTNAAGDYPVVALLTQHGIQTATHFTVDGHCYNSGRDQSQDLVNVPAKHNIQFWIVLTPTGTSIRYLRPSTESVPYCLACKEVNVTITEGEGLGNEQST